MIIINNNVILNKRGQSLVEVVIAMAIFSMIAFSMASMTLGSLTLIEEGGNYTEAEFLAQEGAEAVMMIKKRAWNELIYNKSAIQVDNEQWVLLGENTSEQIGSFSRLINFYSIYRDENNNIVSSTTPNSTNDIGSCQAVIQVQWQPRGEITNTVQNSLYLTNWNSAEWTQNDWAGGSGQEVWEEADKYYNDNGNIDVSINNQIGLMEISTSTYATEGYLISSQYKVSSTTVFNYLRWEEEIPLECSNCDIKIQIKTALDNSGSPEQWTSTWCGPEGDDGDESDYFEVPLGELISVDHNGHQWIQYKVIFSGEADNTPLLYEIKINYQA